MKILGSIKHIIGPKGIVMLDWEVCRSPPNLKRVAQLLLDQKSAESVMFKTMPMAAGVYESADSYIAKGTRVHR